MHTVTPLLVCAGAADAIEFYQKAFGAIELSRVPGSDGKLMHASIRIGCNSSRPPWARQFESYNLPPRLSGRQHFLPVASGKAGYRAA